MEVSKDEWVNSRKNYIKNRILCNHPSVSIVFGVDTVFLGGPQILFSPFTICLYLKNLGTILNKLVRKKYTIFAILKRLQDILDFENDHNNAFSQGSLSNSRSKPLKVGVSKMATTVPIVK